jgi:LysM repeat protein
VDNKPAFEDVVKAFIVGLVAKAKGLMKGVTPRTIIIVGALMSLVAVASMVNMGDAPAPTPKSHNTVVEHNTKATVDVQPAVDVEPADNVVARVDGHNGAVHADEIYTVKSGDTLWDIAVAKYHDGTKWTLIYNANKDKLTHDDVRNVTDAGHWIHAGQSLFVPGGAS